MGQDFKCGCRHSRGWYLCDEHEALLLSDLVSDDEDEESVKG